MPIAYLRNNPLTYQFTEPFIRRIFTATPIRRKLGRTLISYIYRRVIHLLNGIALSFNKEQILEISEQKNLAVLIDAENISPQKIKEILDEVAKYGKASVKRIYGDWTTPQMNTWKDYLHKHAIQPVQQFRYTIGKNATDSAMIIDAMDLLYSGNFDGFCLLSSDSDYTRLAVRIRESGLIAYGIGERKTPESFRHACDQFIYIENLGPIAESEETKQVYDPIEFENDTELVKTAIEDASDEDGWALLSRVGLIIRNKKPDFDFRTYGFKKFSDFIRNRAIFEVSDDHQKVRMLN